LTDQRDGNQPHDSRRVPGEAASVRRPYAAPELVEYGTVAKLTQSGTGSINDFLGMMRMMVCL
jgi:hypothetical protein